MMCGNYGVRKCSGHLFEQCVQDHIVITVIPFLCVATGRSSALCSGSILQLTTNPTCTPPLLGCLFFVVFLLRIVRRGPRASQSLETASRPSRSAETMSHARSMLACLLTLLLSLSSGWNVAPVDATTGIHDFMTWTQFQTEYDPVTLFPMSSEGVSSVLFSGPVFGSVQTITLPVAVHTTPTEPILCTFSITGYGTLLVNFMDDTGKVADMARYKSASPMSARNTSLWPRTQTADYVWTYTDSQPIKAIRFVTLFGNGIGVHAIEMRIPSTTGQSTGYSMHSSKRTLLHSDRTD